MLLTFVLIDRIWSEHRFDNGLQIFCARWKNAFVLNLSDKLHLTTLLSQQMVEYFDQNQNYIKTILAILKIVTLTNTCKQMVFLKQMGRIYKLTNIPDVIIYNYIIIIVGPSFQKRIFYYLKFIIREVDLLHPK